MNFNSKVLYVLDTMFNLMHLFSRKLTFMFSIPGSKSVLHGNQARTNQIATASGEERTLLSTDQSPRD